MGKKIFILLVVALIGMLVLPALASATLTNEYGMHFAGQDEVPRLPQQDVRQILKVASALHGAFATVGVNPAPPVNWTNFSAAGDIPQVGPTATGQVYSQGGIYSITKLPWVTLGAADLGTRPPSTCSSRAVQRPHRHAVEPGRGSGLRSPAASGSSATSDATGLYDVDLQLPALPQLGTTMPTAPPARPCRTRPPPSADAATTAVQWARDDDQDGRRLHDRPDRVVPRHEHPVRALPRHRRGRRRSGHTNTGVERLHRPRGPRPVAGLRPVPRQLHQRGRHAGHLRLHDQPADAQLRRHQRRSRAASRTPRSRRRTSSSPAPTTYWMFPNGSNAKGNHYYYNEWSASAHSYRAAL